MCRYLSTARESHHTEKAVNEVLLAHHEDSIQEGMNRPKILVVALTAVLSLVVAAVALSPAATEYEVSIYDAYSPLIWVGFGTVLVGGVLLVVFGARTNSNAWLIGIVFVVAAYGVFYALPLVRDYALYGTPLSDSLYHLGVVSDILSTGSVPIQLYPETQILFAELSSLTGLSPRAFQLPISYVFSMLFMIGCFVSGRHFFSKTGGYYVLAAAIPLSYTGLQLTILPWFYALCLIPLVLWALHVKMGVSATIIGLVLTITTVLYHPLTGLFALVIIGLYVLWTTVNPQRTVSRGGAIGLTAGIMATVWALESDRVQNLLVRTVVGVEGNPGVASYIGRAGSERSLSELFVEFVVLQWGPLFLFVGAAGFVVLYIGYRSLRERRVGPGAMFSSQYIAGGLFGVAFATIGVLSQNPVRISQFVLFFSIYLVGFGLWTAFGRGLNTTYRQVRSVAGAVLLLVVIVSVLLSAGIAYEDNRHITHSTLEGSEWHLKYQNPDIQTKAFRMSRNVELFLKGYTAGRQGTLTFSRFRQTHHLPTAFGYENNSTIAKTLNERAYLITRYSDLAWARSQPSREHPIQKPYSASDLTRLNRDSAAQRVYSNGNFVVWLS